MVNKRGISAIVATVLIILITVAAVTIVWTAIIPMIGELDMQDFDVQFRVDTASGYTVYDKEKEKLLVRVGRGVDESVIEKIKIIVNFGGETYNEIVDAPESNQYKVYAFDIAGYVSQYGDPTEISVAPLIIDGDSVNEGTSSSSVEIPEGNIIDVDSYEWIIFGGEECTSEDTQDCGPSNEEGICTYGTQTCVDNQWGDCINAVYPETETCNGLDDDCDGTVDGILGVSLTRGTTCGIGVCASTGTETCTLAGVFEGDTCVAGTPTENPEVSCSDYLDNDCNGDIDGEDSNCGGCSGTAVYEITGTEVCSSEYGSSFTCDKSSNGILSDNWYGSGTGAPEWIYADLGSNRCISGVRVYIYSSDVPQTMDIQVSDDAISWTTVESDWTVTEGESWINKDFAEVQGRYLRFYITSCNRVYCNFRDFEIKSRLSS